MKMTTVKSSTVLQSITSIVPIIVLLGGMMVGYANLHTSISLLTATQETSKVTVLALDKYDRYLQRQQEGTERRLLIVETKQKVIQDTQIRLETKLDRILSELKTLGTAITELKTIQKHN